MKKLMAVLLSMMCAACTPTITKVNVPDMAKSDSLPVRDMRPNSEKEHEFFSLLVSSKEYGIVREGDTRLSPAPSRLLQHQLFEKFDVAGELPKVDLYHFVVYSNMKSKLRSQAVFAGIGGILGGLAANAAATHVAMASTETVDGKMFDDWSGDNEYQRALFTEAENPTKAPVYIIYIDTDIDGKRVLTRTVSPIKQHEGTNSLVTAVQLAIANHLGHYNTGVLTAEAVSATPKSLDSPAVAPSSAAASPAATSPAASTATAPLAQSVANQLGCGVVTANGDSTYVAPCGDHGVVIDCSGGRCHPTHTVRIE